MDATPPPLRLLQTPRRHRTPVEPLVPGWSERCAASLHRAWSEARARLTMRARTG